MLSMAAAAIGCARDAAPSPSPSSSPEPGSGPRLTAQKSGTTNRLQAVSAVDERVVWASGVGGTTALTIDGGATWRARVLPGAEKLELRDVHGVSASVAYVLSAGEGTRSRIYKTVDGGETWSLEFENRDPARFYDCFAFWSPARGVTMADSVNGRFPVIETTDGQAWVEIGDRLPAALQGEAAFAASGTCIATQGEERAWIVTGSAARARVLATSDGGETWTAHDTPVAHGAGAGGFSIAFRDSRRGILGGGKLDAPADRSTNFARSRDGGTTWEPRARTPFPGAIYGVSYALGRGHAGDSVAVVATGPGGAAWSPDEGGTWFNLPGAAGYWAVAFASAHTGWLVGTEGRILKIDL